MERDLKKLNYKIGDDLVLARCGSGLSVLGTKVRLINITPNGRYIFKNMNSGEKYQFELQIRIGFKGKYNYQALQAIGKAKRNFNFIKTIDSFNSDEHSVRKINK